MKNLWENPEIQQLDRLPARSPLLPYDSPEAARKECAAGPENASFPQSPFVKLLNGIWKFRLLNTPDEDSQKKSDCRGWLSPDFEDILWEDINVPGTWTLQGFDKPHYTNVQMPFDTVPPNVPDKNPTGLYRLTVDVPSAWENRRVVLHIGSAESCTLVWINGKQAGMSKDTRLPCEFDITPYLLWKNHQAKTVIAVKVIRYSDASFVEDQDQWWFGGIHRSVYLYSTENIYIEDIEALTRIDGPIVNNTAKGIIPLKVTIGFSDDFRTIPQTNTGNLTIKHIFKYEVCPLAGSPEKYVPGDVAAFGQIEAYLDYRNDQYQLTKDIEIPNAALWSSEHPHLYIITAALYEQSSNNPGTNSEVCRSRKVSQSGEYRHRESVSFITGFKSIEIKNRELLINGKPVYICGVNRHEHNEYHGKTLSTREMVYDIHTLKQYNFNAVRTCHYPDDERWYDLCDRYGIYLMDEANIENHAYYDCLCRSDAWTYSYMTRVQRMVRRDKNHASVFCWSLGNESGDGQNQVACQAWLRSVDPTRIIHYEGFVRPERTQGAYTFETLARGKWLADLISPMYPDIDLIVKYAETCRDYRPIIMCEYSHAMGNANGSLSDYWTAIRKTHGLQGGFIWDWIDQGIAADAPKGKAGEPQGGKYWKYGGDFGDIPSDYDFCLNGINFPDQTPKPAMEECKKLFAPIKLYAVHPLQGIFKVENLYDFSTLDNIKMNWFVLSNGNAVTGGSLSFQPGNSAKQNFPSKSVDPGTCFEFRIPDVTEALHDADASEEIIFHAEFVYIRATPWALSGAPVGKDEIVLSEAKTWQDFSKNTETVSAANGSSTEPFSRIVTLAGNFKPVLFYALTENECIKRELPNLHNKNRPQCFMNNPATAWIDSDIMNMQIIQLTEDDFDLYTGPAALQYKKIGTVTRKIARCKIQHGVNAVQLNMTFMLSDALPEYPRAGISVLISSAYTDVLWYGRGPHECYSDRKAGALKGTYSMKIKNLEVPYIVPQENGSRCDVNYLELNGAQKQLHIQSALPFYFSISKYTDQNLFKCEHHNELTDLSLGISGYYILHIDAAHRGVGTGACGPDTLEQYRIRPGSYKLTLVIW